MRLKLSFLLVLFTTLSFALQLSPKAEISVLTFGPGTSLNDAFGHNAFRIKDQGIDLVYGYGEYDFDAPNFYLKFARGKLNYLISRHRFSDIYRYYSGQNRSISEQILNLSEGEKQKLFEFLENNYKPENRAYQYDFFYDNCATKIRDVAQKVTDQKIDYVLPENFEQVTFRELIHEHLNRNTWGSLGIDIALGSVIDRDAIAYEYMYLPKYIYGFFEEAKFENGTNVIKNSSELYSSRSDTSSSNILLSPLVIFSLLAVLIIYITLKDNKRNQRTRWLDALIAMITGIIGLLLLFLWFGTDHSATANNYNLLWAFPFNILIVNQLRRQSPKKWMKGYLKFLIIMLVLLTMHWVIGVQVFAIGLIPFLLAIALRYIYIVKIL